MRILIIFLAVIFCSCSKPQQLVGGPCEGCEAVFEYGDKALAPFDSLPGFNEKGTQIKISGTIYKNDEKTPAEDVVLYIYHTNQEGIYKTEGDESGWGKRHGFMRGWVKTGKDGRYTFYTIKPGSYPRSRESAHIHAIILEPDGRYYWIDDFLFDDDPFLTTGNINKENPRGGSGIVKLEEENNINTAVRDIILGKNVRGY
jgi:protocatechuate 3,4-dioxygenase, beta subunit